MTAGPERDELDRKHMEATAALRKQLQGYEMAIAVGPIYGTRAEQ
jgi:hypothetical protein